jgi:polysaccharide pyruvyl transferase WcaK-like protein
MKKTRPIKRIALFGAAPDTPNMGVSALFMSTITGLARHIDDFEVVVFDYGLGLRNENLSIAGGKLVKLIRYGARGGKRYYRPENLLTMLFLSRLGWLGSLLNPGLRLLDTCDAVLDVSGGDSFSDIYGLERFNNVNRPKTIALNRKRPLILLPQTFGPYTCDKVRKEATNSIKNATSVWARDKHSFDILRNLLGDSFSPEQHRCGIDMAFGLEPLIADNQLGPTIHSWLKANEPVVGINISGLIYKHPERAKNSYGFIADYNSLIQGLIDWLLAHSDVKIILISHVMDTPGHYESDYEASETVAAKIPDQYKNRLEVAPLTLNESQVKWLISKLDWFCGTRMHSTIAGLSTGVPTSAISYSDKTKGVFETVNQGAHVIDPRQLENDAALESLVNSFRSKLKTRESLRDVLKDIHTAVDNQMRLIAESINA